MLVPLLLEKFLNEYVFFFIFVETLLGVDLVDSEFSTPAFTLLTREIALLFCLFYLVHCGREGKVLDLAWR